MTHDPDAISRVFSLLEGPSGVHWMAKSPRGYAVVGGPARDATSLIKNAARQDGWDFFVCLNPAVDGRSAKPAKSAISHLAVLGLDFDPTGVRPALPSDDAVSNNLGVPGREQVLSTAVPALGAILADLTGAPNSHIIVDSGRGLWAWLFVEPVELISDAHRHDVDGTIKGFTAAVAARLGDVGASLRIDTASAELSRVARCPGTVNSKTGALARILIDYFPIERTRYSLLEKLAAPHLSAVKNLDKPSPVAGSSVADIAPHMNMTSRQFVLVGVDSSVESRHARLFSAAKNLYELGISQDIAEYVLWSGAERCRPNLNWTSPGQVRKVVAQVWKTPRTYGTPPPSNME